MTKRTTLLVLATLLAGRLCLAQNDAPAGDWHPASSNQPGKEYPKVNSEGRVTFRIVAPEATRVGVTFRNAGEFTKGEDGAWYGTTGPLDEGFHYYLITIDGAEVPDPNSMMFFGAMRWGSAIEIPAHDQAFYALKNVPHGQLRELFFHSESTDTMRRAFVYTPPGYDQSPSTRHPVLYLQHGWGENEYGWGEQGRVAWIMDNLLAEGRTRPFIIVMTYGMTNDIQFGGLRNFDIGPFETVLVRELIPYIDANFRTLADQPHRAMAGLSMGGMETRTITLRHPDVFSHIGLFSGGSIGPDELADPAAFKEQNRLVFVGYGSRELGGNRRGGDPKANTEALTQAGINSRFYESPDTGHEWQTWRRSLQQFAPLLFVDQPLPAPVAIVPARPAAEPAAAAPAIAADPAAPASPAGVVRIKAGRFEPIDDAEGNRWLADQGFQGGLTIERPGLPIANTLSPDLYRAERYSMDSFFWPVPNGHYDVKLHFAETFEGITGPGERVFSFSVQGKAFKDFDVWAKAGGFATAYIETVPVVVTNGNLTITFTPKIENPQICAIEIRSTRQVGDFGSSEATARRAPDAAPGAPAAAPVSSGTSGSRAESRRGPDLGPLPDIHAPVPNTLPGLLGKPLKWVSTGPLVGPQNDSTHFLYSVKDPTVFRYQDKWEIYATAYMVSGPAAAALLNPDAAPASAGRRRGDGGGWNMVHLSFADWNDAPNATLFYMDSVPGFSGYMCAPEVFYFAPQKTWYYIFQTQRPAYSTSVTPDDPTSWTAPQQFFTPDVPTPRLPIDYHCIGDGEYMYLFFTGDDGNFYRSRTSYAEFPQGFGSAVVALRGTRDTVFEGSFTYKIKGVDKYLTCVEALSPTRFYRAYLADTLDGEWYPVEGLDTFEQPFAGINNLTFENGVEPWTSQVSHGEMIRDGNNERMILDPNRLMFLYQGIADADNRGDYGRLPYRLGLLRAVGSQ